ncbi:hypothetical protein WUBG_18699, partial [Wuchereria bancrofti]
SYRHREVNSFQFPDEEIIHGEGDSPELGIREHIPDPIDQEIEDDEEFGDFALARNLHSQFQKVSSPSLITAQPYPIHKPYQLYTVNVPIPAAVLPPPPSLPPSGPSAIATTVKHRDNGILLQNKPVSGS